MNERPVQSPPSMVRRLLAAVVLAAGFGPAGCGVPGTVETDYSKNPVLFVHGHGLHAGDWDAMIAAFVESGYPAAYLSAVQITPNRMANIDAAEDVLKPAAAELLSRAGGAAAKAGYYDITPSKLDIVAHSMGALSSRWLATRLIPENVEVWIGIAPANHGSDALCSHTDPGAADLCPAFAQSAGDSFVQVALNGTRDKPADETPWGIGADANPAVRVAPEDSKSMLYFTVRIEPDEWIKPERSAVLDGAGGASVAVPDYMKETRPGNFLFLPERVGRWPVSHENILVDERLIGFVGRLLSQNAEPASAR